MPALRLIERRLRQRAEGGVHLAGDEPEDALRIRVAVVRDGIDGGEAHLLGEVADVGDRRVGRAREVAQDRAARRSLARNLAFRTTLPIVVMVLLLLFLVSDWKTGIWSAALLACAVPLYWLGKTRWQNKKAAT